MKPTTFIIFFKNPAVTPATVSTSGQFSAEILAMADKIRMGHDYRIEKVLNAETKESLPPLSKFAAEYATKLLRILSRI